MFYVEDFDKIQKDNKTFLGTVLSDPLPDDDWKGSIGFIHNILYDQYLKPS